MQSEAHVPWFRVVFEMTDGKFDGISNATGRFRELEKGDRGMLTYQGNRYICYQKYKFKSEAQEEEKMLSESIAKTGTVWDYNRSDTRM